MYSMFSLRYVRVVCCPCLSARFFFFTMYVFCILTTICAHAEVEHDSDKDELIAVSDPRKGGKPAGSYNSEV